MLLITLLFSTLLNASDLKTKAEKTDYQETGRYEEVIRLCQGYAKTYSSQVKCEKFGTTPEGRPMLALVLGKTDKSKPVVFFQGGIHSGEIDGKDAGFLVVEETLTKFKSRLDKLSIVFVPVFNIDGHERFGAYNRPNQVGPKEMGWRTTGQNLNLNRDYMKADGPEMQAMLRLLNKYDPVAYLDLHVTDGADFQPEISVQVSHALKSYEAIQKLGLSIQNRLMDALTKKNHMPLPFYPSFVKDDEPSSGFEVGIAPPRFSQSYWGLHNRFGFLVETHSWKNYKTRVIATKDTLDEVIGMVEKEGKEWKDVLKKADEEASELAGKKVVLLWDATKDSTPIEFPGYHYEITDSKISGQKKIQFFPQQKEIWKIPLFDKLQPALEVVAPKSGYLVPIAHSNWIAEKLKAHGVRFSVVKNKKELSGKSFVTSEFEFGKKSYEGRLALTVKGEWKDSKVEVLPGSLFIPISQPLSHIALHLFEPKSKDSLLSWGYFNAFYEQKEYMENYVTEAVAEEMLKNSSIAKEFEEKLKDEAFSKSPEKRLEFFYKKHPSWDKRFGQYPISQLEQVP